MATMKCSIKSGMGHRSLFCQPEGNAHPVRMPLAAACLSCNFSEPPLRTDGNCQDPVTPPSVTVFPPSHSCVRFQTWRLATGPNQGVRKVWRTRRRRQAGVDVRVPVERSERDVSARNFASRCSRDARWITE
jgi:hypothetical protein